MRIELSSDSMLPLKVGGKETIGGIAFVVKFTEFTYAEPAMKLNFPNYIAILEDETTFIKDHTIEK